MIYTFYGRVSTDSDEQISALDNQEQYWKDYFNDKKFEMNQNCGVFTKETVNCRLQMDIT